MSDRYVSHSQIDMLSRCGQQWVFRYVDGLRVPPSVKMVIGNAVDRGVGPNLRSMRDGEGMLTEEDVAERTYDGLLYEWGARGVVLDESEKEDGLVKTRGKAADRAVAMATLHRRAVAPKLKPTHVQRRFEIKVPGYDATLVGVIDTQEGTERARDTKTTAKSINTGSADADESTQLTMYSMAIEVADGKAPDSLHLDYLVDKSHLKTPKPPTLVQLATARSRDHYRALLMRLEQALKVMESGIITPAPPGSWWCSPKWCGYWDRCPFVSSASVAVGGQAVDLTQTLKDSLKEKGSDD